MRRYPDNTSFRVIFIFLFLSNIHANPPILFKSFYINYLKNLSVGNGSSLSSKNWIKSKKMEQGKREGLFLISRFKKSHLPICNEWRVPTVLRIMTVGMVLFIWLENPL